MSDKKIDRGGYAFPCGSEHPTRGMTLRDYFAAAALTGILSDPTTGNEDTDDEDECQDIRRDYAAAAYDFADAMLEARKK